MADAARILGVSLDTVKRRVKRGELVAAQERTARGFRWVVELPDFGEINANMTTFLAPAPDEAAPAPAPAGAPAVSDAAPADAPADVEHLHVLIAAQRGHIEDLRAQTDTLRDQLAVKDGQLEARTREISELHVLLQRAQAAALPAPTSIAEVESIAPETAAPRPWWRFWR